jgi:hypothetical protein
VVECSDGQLRSLLGPISELAARRQVTILLVKHLVGRAAVMTDKPTDVAREAPIGNDAPGRSILYVLTH